HIQFDSNARKILLHHGCHAFAGFVTGIGDYRKFDRMPVVIAQGAILKGEAVLREAPHRGFLIKRVRLQFRIEPEFIGRTDGANRWTRMPAKYYARDVLAVDGLGNSPAEVCR